MFDLVFCVCRRLTTTDLVFSIIRDLVAESGSKRIKMADLEERCVSKGYKPDQLKEALDEFEDLNVLQVNTARTTITFV